MKQLNLTEAKAKLSHLLDQAARGKGVIIAKSGIPMAKLVPLDDEKPQQFKLGTLKDVPTDEVVKAIEAPLPGDLLDAAGKGRKALLAAAPLEGTDIRRSRDPGRDIDL